MRRLFTFLFATMLAGQAGAWDFKSGDLYYDIYSDSTVAVTYLSRQSTSNYSELGEIVIPEKVIYNNIEYAVTYIGGYAFYGCGGLTSVTIPESITSIGYSAFYGCGDITSVTIPESVTYIGDYAFSGCSKMKEINVESANTAYASVNGVLFNKEKNNLICYPNGKAETIYTIPESVTSIGPQAFVGCSGLTSVTIPESVTKISDYAFWGCRSLVSVTMPESVTSIGFCAFVGCTGLTSVIIPESVMTIGARAFEGCNGLETANFNARNCTSGGMFFEGCTSLKTINIGENVENIPSYAFYGCNGITSVTIPGSVTSIGEGAFLGCSSLTSVTIPESVTAIDYKAFENSFCTLYCEVPSRPIGWAYFFDNFSGTIYWNIHNPKFTNDFIFNTISDKEPYEIEIYKYIGDSIVVKVPTSVEFDGKEYAVTCVRNGAFGGYNNLDYTAYGNAFYIGNEENPYLILMEAKNTKIESCEINRRCRFIYSEAFNGCSKLSEISIPDSVINIGNDAFSGCSGLTKASFASVEQICGIKFGNSTANPLSITQHLYIGTTEVTNLSIPETVKSIGDYAFYGCNYISSVTIPNSVEVIGDYAFYNCGSLNSISIGNMVGRIGSCAFYGCIKLTEVYIPETVKCIGTNAFIGCFNMQKAEFASIESLCSINYENNAANPLYNAHNLYVNGEPVINLVIPGTVKSIGAYAFYYCTNLASLTITDSVKIIGTQAFNSCSRLASIEIPNSVTEIGDNTFSGCSGLKSLSYNSNVIGVQFNNISGLESIFIGDSVKNISGAEFKGCDNLVNVISLATVPPALNGDPYTFADTIWVPAASVDAYKAAPVWKRKEIMPLDYYTVLVAKIDTARGSVIGDGNFAAKQAITIYATSAENYHFKSWSDGNTENPRTIMLYADVDVSAIFEGDTRVVNINANVSSSGSVSSNVASYHYGDTITISASANNGYHFVKWSDGVTDNPRIVIIDGDLAFEAVFEADENTAVTELAANNFKIYTRNRTIIIENATDEIHVYDAMGKLVCRDAIHRVRATITVNTPGVYIVKTGNVVNRIVVN